MNKNNIMMAFSMIDDWIYHHSINDDNKNIEDAMKTIHDLVLKEIRTSKN